MGTPSGVPLTCLSGMSGARSLGFFVQTRARNSDPCLPLRNALAPHLCVVWTNETRRPHFPVALPLLPLNRRCPAGAVPGP